MSTQGKTLLFLVTAACAAVAAFMAWAHDWRYWQSPLAVPVVLLAALAVVGRPRTATASAGYDGSVEAPDMWPSAPSAMPFREPQDRDTAVVNIPVPSAAPNYAFLFSATVNWRPLSADMPVLTSAIPSTLAVNAIIERVKRQTANDHPVDYVQAQHRLAAVLGTMNEDPGGVLKAWATDVKLALRAEDFDRLRKLDEMEKEQEVWERELTIERSRRTYLGEDVFKDAGSAVVWWLARRGEKKDEEIERTVELIGSLAQLAAAANNEDVAEPFRRFLEPPAWPDGVGPDEDGAAQWPSRPGTALTVAEHVGRIADMIGFEPSTEERMRCGRVFAKTLVDLGADSDAAQVREAFDVFDLDADARPQDADEVAGYDGFNGFDGREPAGLG